MHTSSTVDETYLELGRNIPPARSNIPQAGSKDTSSLVEIYLKHGKNRTRARSKHNSGTVEMYLEHGQIIPRTWSKHASSMVETHIQRGRKLHQAQSNLHCAESKHISSMVETYLECNHILSPVET